MIMNMITAVTQTTRLNALREHLKVNESEEIEFGEDNHFHFNGNEYEVLLDDEADERANNYIKESLWAFNARFIAERMPCAKEMSDRERDAFIEVIKGFQEKMSEGCNSVFRALIGDNLDALINEAVYADGRGHFLNTYDGEEQEILFQGVWYYIYRIN